MQVQEVVDKLDLNKTAKDHIWKVEPSCATTGAGIFEGLVSLPYPHNLGFSEPSLLIWFRRLGSHTTSRYPSQSNRSMSNLIDTPNSTTACTSAPLCIYPVFGLPFTYKVVIYQYLSLSSFPYSTSFNASNVAFWKENGLYFRQVFYPEFRFDRPVLFFYSILFSRVFSGERWLLVEREQEIRYPGCFQARLCLFPLLRRLRFCCFHYSWFAGF